MNSVSQHVVAVADAGPGVGFGHLSRTSAVVTALATRGITCRCLGFAGTVAVTFDRVTWQPAGEAEVRAALAGAAAGLLDSYLLPMTSLPAAGPLVCFHDPGQPPPPAARLVIAPPQDREEPERWLTGLRYACLRPAYWGAVPVAAQAPIRRVLVTTGGTDPGGISARLAEAVRRALPDAEIRRVRGLRAPALSLSGLIDLEPLPDLAGELRGAGAVVCLGGQTALEAATLGVPTVAVAAVENQRANVARLAGAGAVEAAATPEEVTGRLAQLAADPARRLARSEAARRAVDGFGALRVAARVQALLERAADDPFKSVF